MSKEVVFISGASRGIGTAIAESFAQLGHTVIGTSRSEFKFESNLDNLIPLALDIQGNRGRRRGQGKERGQNGHGHKWFFHAPSIARKHPQ